MDAKFKQELLKHFNASDAIELGVVQELWSGYGKIVRVQIVDGDVDTIIVKQVIPPEVADHPKGWDTQASHERKLKSYQVELAWYKKYGLLSTEACRLPRYYMSSNADGVTIAMEDLDAAGYSVRKTRVNLKEIKRCLSWLAHFHATFMHTEPNDLWEVGTYWHLDTRRDEFEAMAEGGLKAHAMAIDSKLNYCVHQTFVHGDAKLANFCFSAEGEQVAAVDFQYVGGGCGMKDVAYFLGSCLDEKECEELENELLDYYFSILKSSLQEQHAQINFEPVEQEWRALYPYVCADFARFLLGWSPGHQKLNAYAKQMVGRVLS